MTALQLLTHVDNCLSRYALSLTRFRTLMAFAPDSSGKRPALCAKDVIKGSRHKLGNVQDAVNYLEKIGLLFVDRKMGATKFLIISSDGEAVIREALSGKVTT